MENFFNENISFAVVSNDVNIIGHLLQEHQLFRRDMGKGDVGEEKKKKRRRRKRRRGMKRRRRRRKRKRMR